MKQFDVKGILEEKIQPLLDYQQEKLPFSLALNVEKGEFSVGESVVFTAVLRNKTTRSLRLQALGENSMYFLYDKRPWGAKEASARGSKGVQTVILRPGESLQERFVGEAFNFPEDFEIYGEYAVPYNGVKATSTLKIKVVE